MKYIIFLILIFIIVFMYFYYEKKLLLAKKRILLTSNQMNNVKNKYRSSLIKTQNVNVQFKTPPFKTAITNNNVNVFLAPLQDSPKINTLNIKMEVKILDSAFINNTTWYYVTLPIDSDYNCRGWIKSTDFSIVYSQSKDVSNTYN